MNGVLINNSYEFVVTAAINTCCLCCNAQPKVFTTLDVIAPDYVMTEVVMVEAAPVLKADQAP